MEGTRPLPPPENSRFEATPRAVRLIDFGISNSHTQDDAAVLQTTPFRSHRTHLNHRRRSQSPNSLLILVSGVDILANSVLPNIAASRPLCE